MNKLLYLAAAAAAVLCASSVPSSALTCGTGCAESQSPYFTFTNPPATGDHGFFGDSALSTSAFTDDFLFDLVSPPTSFNSMTDEITATDATIPGLTLSIWQCTSGGSSCSASTEVADNTTPTISGGDQSIKVTANDLPVGFYFIQVTGGANDAGSFSGNITIDPTPLPTTLALFSVGLALLGLASRYGRRKSKDRLLTSAIA
jgi:hypothetical protein